MGITIYTSPVCASCRQLKAWLDSKEIEYEEKDILANAEEVQRISGYLHAPTTVVGDRVIVGPNLSAIASVLQQ